MSSDQAPIQFLEFTPPTWDNSNSSVTQSSSSAPQTSLSARTASTINDGSISTPKVPPKRRIRRTKEQISQGITLEQLRLE